MNIMKRKLLFFSLFLTSLTLTAANVKDFGVKGDGKTLETKKIQAAIDKLSQQGGGELFFPVGQYLTGTIILKDNVTLHISKGAVILGSTSLEDYPITPIKYLSHVNRYTNRYLFFAEGVENIGIKGEGMVDGRGDHVNFTADKNDALLSIIERPYILRFVSCDKVKVTGITLKNSPSWMQHYLHCTNVYIEGLTIFNHGNYNNDGIDIDNCKNVQILSCNIDTDDDGICFKSTNSADVCENIVVSNCIVASNCNAIKFGTETNGGFRNVSISNCSFHRPQLGTIYDRPHRALGGFAISTVDGAVLEGITIDNISMNGVMTPIFLRLANRGRNFYDGGPSQPPGILRNINISNVTAVTEGLVPSSITGIEGHYIENVSLSNIRIITPGGVTLENAQRRNLPEMEKEYPETLLFIDAPAYGLYVRHVKGLMMDNIVFESKAADYRSAMYCEDTHNMMLTRYSFFNPYTLTPFVTMMDVRNISMLNNLAGTPNNSLLQIEGSSSEKITLSEKDIENYLNPVVYTKGATTEAIIPDK